MQCPEKLSGEDLRWDFSDDFSEGFLQLKIN